MNTVEIAKEIKRQIMGQDFWCLARMGANGFVALPEGEGQRGGLMFKVRVPKAKVGGVLRITLNGGDLYDIKLVRVRKNEMKVVASASDIYFDQLIETLERVVA